MSQQLQAQSERLLAGPKRLRRQAENWISQQPPYIEVAVATLLGGGQGAFLGTVMGTLTKLDPNAGKMFTPPAGANPEMAQRMSAIQAGGPMAQAKNFAVMTGVNAGLSLAVKRYRGGVEDVRGVMIAGFGSGAAFSLVSGMTQGNPSQGAFSTGVLFALLQGAFYQVGKRFQQPAGLSSPAQYERAHYMLDRLGLTNYQKNLKRALLTDNTIMLWNDGALQEARIPPGPRLLILHHLEQYKHILKPGMPAPNQLPLPPQEPRSA
ncbi:hypothetical protein ABBQ32_004638 [Trebouxia sp. C0010 RCD-2024]